MIDLSIIIVNWNTKELLRKCLQSVYNTIRNVTFEIFIVDNNSSDGSAVMVREEFSLAKLIENKRNEGFARANNKAIRRAKGRYILLLNSDTVVLRQALDKMVEFMSKHRGAGVLGCKLINKDGSLQFSAAWFSIMAMAVLGSDIVPKALGRVFKMRKFPGQTYLTAKDHDRLQEVDWVVGACMLVRREAINEVGLLDENLFLYGEETEWCFRIKKAGWRIIYFPGAKIIHYGGGSAKAQSKIYMYRKAFAERYIYHKHHNYLSSRIYDLLITTMAIVKLLIWGILLPVLPNKNKALTHLYFHRGIIQSITGSKFMNEK